MIFWSLWLLLNPAAVTATTAEGSCRRCGCICVETRIDLVCCEFEANDEDGTTSAALYCFGVAVFGLLRDYSRIDCKKILQKYYKTVALLFKYIVIEIWLTLIAVSG